MGLKVQKWNTVMKQKQKKWLKPDFDLNTKVRSGAEKKLRIHMQKYEQ